MAKWFNLSLNIKVLTVATVVGFSIALLVAALMYSTTVAPVQPQVEQELVTDMERYINAQIELKIQSGVMGANAFSLQPNLIEAVNFEDRDMVRDLFAGVRDGYRDKTIFQNIATVLFSRDGRILMRSWDLDNYGQDATDNPLVQRALQERRAFADLGLGARGIGVTAIAPILENGEVIGLVSLIQGLFSVGQDFRETRNGEWLLLVDARYISERYGQVNVLNNNRYLTEHYFLANNNWFDEDAENFLRQHLQPVDGEHNQVYTTHGRAVIDLPAFDETGAIFGRHVFVLDEAVFMEPIQTAMRTAWLSLLGVVAAIFAVSLALVVTMRSMVIKPLQGCQGITSQIVATGDFSLRAEVRSSDEVGKTAQSINHLLTAMSNALTEANHTVQALAAGDFSQRMQGHYAGDLDQLKSGINRSADSIAAIMQQISRILRALRDGEFGIQVDYQAQGEYEHMLRNAQTVTEEMNRIIEDINRVMQAMSEGHFAERVTVEARGDMHILKERINSSMDQLNAALQDISAIVIAQSQGDLTRTITAEYQGDLRTLKDAVNNSMARLAEIVSRSMETASIVDTAAAEVAQGASDLSQRVQQQASALEQTAATMEEINSAVRSNSDDAQKAVSVSSRVQDQASASEQVMHQTIAAMNAIQQSSHRIAEIVTLIDGIAFQTNLLALNAAVEAARAGDHGRGFAVVASEVRNLAQKSAEAAKDIKKLIDESVKRIDDGTHLATESGEHLTAIIESIGEVTAMINRIATASASQTQSILEVHTVISDMDSATQQNAALVEQTSAAAESMGEQASSLNQNMAFFKTSSAGQLGLPAPGARTKT